MGLFSKIGTAVGSFFGGPVGGAVGSFAGGLLDREDSNDSAQARFDRDAGLSAQQRQQEYERQKEFAQMGIRWRAADASAAGLHPLAAIGGGGSSYSPTVVMPNSQVVEPQDHFSDFSDSLKAMGQNTTRAEVATQNPFEREMQVLALRRSELQNQLIEGQIAAQWASVMGQPGNPAGPAAAGPTTGVVVSPVRSPMTVPRALVQIEPSKGVSASRNSAGVEAARTPFTKEYELGHGSRVRLPSQGASEALESLGPLGWAAGAGLTGYQALREWWKGPEGGPPHPSMRWSPWKRAWTNH